MKLDERQPGPVVREHPCAGGCGECIEDSALCDGCRARYAALGEMLAEHLTAAECAWMDATREAKAGR